MKSSDERDPSRSARWSRVEAGWGLGEVSLESTRSWWVDRDMRYVWRMTKTDALERRSIADIDDFGEVVVRVPPGDSLAFRVDFLGRTRPLAIVTSFDAIERWTIGETIERRTLIGLEEGPFDEPTCLGCSVSADGSRLLVSAPGDRGLVFELTADDDLALVASIDAPWLTSERIPAHALVGDNIAVVEGDDTVLRTYGGAELARVRGVRVSELVPVDDHRVLVARTSDDRMGIVPVVIDFRDGTKRDLEGDPLWEFRSWVCSGALYLGKSGEVREYSLDDLALRRTWTRAGARMAACRDGVLYGVDEAGFVALDLATMQTVREQPAEQSSVESMCFDHDGRRLLVTTRSSLRLLDASTGETLAVRHGTLVNSAAVALVDGGTTAIVCDQRERGVVLVSYAIGDGFDERWSRTLSEWGVDPGSIVASNTGRAACWTSDAGVCVGSLTNDDSWSSVSIAPRSDGKWKTIEHTKSSLVVELNRGFDVFRAVLRDLSRPPSLRRVDRVELDAAEGWAVVGARGIFVRVRLGAPDWQSEWLVIDRESGTQSVWKNASHPYRDRFVLVAPRARRMAVLWAPGHEASVHEFDGRELARWPVVDPWDEARSMALSPDGRTLAVGTVGGALRVFGVGE